MKELEHYYFECECNHDCHRLIFSIHDFNVSSNGQVVKHPSHLDVDLYSSIFLETNPWYSRIWTAIKYIFGYKCIYGDFGNWSMSEGDADKMIELMNKYKQLKAKYRAIE